MLRIPKITLFAAALAMVCMSQLPASAQEKKTGKEKTEKESDAGVKMKDGYMRLAGGLEYKIVKHGKGERKPQLNDHIELHISRKVGDSLMYSSRKMNNDKPVPLQISKPKFKDDPMQVFKLLVAGDSAVVRYPLDSMKTPGSPLPPWAKPGDYDVFYIQLVAVRSDAEEKKDVEEKAAKQTGIDDKELQEYFKKNNLKPSKTASGLYYTISSPGFGENIKAGESVGVNYTGTFISGKKFDSNTDSAFHHMTPFVLQVGKGHVIKGWDEGLQLLKKGGKATFYIPSTLAYGSQDRGAQMPANSILIFDVEVLDMPDQGHIDDSLIKDYLKKNNINATKTNSGLYYEMTRKGVGPKAVPGKKITMNYTGETLEGKKFDSNIDPAFGHVAPFTFPLGEGRVIPGWEEGVQLLQMGSKARFFIPSGMAYGSQGSGSSIPPNTVLIFDVEVTGIDK